MSKDESVWVIFIKPDEIPFYVIDNLIGAKELLKKILKKHKNAWVCEMDHELLTYYYSSKDNELNEIFDIYRKELNLH